MLFFPFFKNLTVSKVKDFATKAIIVIKDLKTIDDLLLSIMNNRKKYLDKKKAMKFWLDYLPAFENKIPEKPEIPQFTPIIASNNFAEAPPLRTPPDSRADETSESEDTSSSQSTSRQDDTKKNIPPSLTYEKEKPFSLQDRPIRKTKRPSSENMGNTINLQGISKNWEPHKEPHFSPPSTHSSFSLTNSQGERNVLDDFPFYPNKPPLNLPPSPKTFNVQPPLNPFSNFSNLSSSIHHISPRSSLNLQPPLNNHKNAMNHMNLSSETPPLRTPPPSPPKSKKKTEKKIEKNAFSQYDNSNSSHSENGENEKPSGNFDENSFEPKMKKETITTIFVQETNSFLRSDEQEKKSVLKQPDPENENFSSFSSSSSSHSSHSSSFNSSSSSSSSSSLNSSSSFSFISPTLPILPTKQMIVDTPPLRPLEFEINPNPNLNNNNNNNNQKIIPQMPWILENEEDKKNEFENEKKSLAASAVVELEISANFQWKKGQILGKGGFGNVYLGFSLTTGALFAVKQLEIDENSSENLKKNQASFQKEIEIMKNLNHENIVRYLGTQFKENILSIFLEYVPGGSIASYMSKFGAFEENIIVLYTRQILKGLHYLHSCKIVHR
jgi:hypothetical protein